MIASGASRWNAVHEAQSREAATGPINFGDAATGFGDDGSSVPIARAMKRIRHSLT